MTKPTVTRSELREMICLEDQMAFHRNYGNSLSPDSTSSSAFFVDNTLTEADDTWNGHWFYLRTTGETRKITDWISSDAKGVFDRPLSVVLDSSDEYEITSHFSPSEIHQSINRAIRDGFPAFFDEVSDETLVLQEDKLTYDLSTLNKKPWTVIDVSLERPSSSYRGIATGAGSNSLTDSSANFSSDVNTDWVVTIYGGSGSGQVRSVASATSNQIVVSTNFSPSISVGSKYLLYNPLKETRIWYDLTRLKFDQVEYPTRMYLSSIPTPYLGSRLRIRYTTAPSDLNADTDETSVPAEFIINKAMAILCKSRANDNRADRIKYLDLYRMYSQEAEMVRRLRSFQPPSATLWQEPNWDNNLPLENPMGW